MARKKRTPKLSLGELRLMGVLWERGPCTLAESYQLQPGDLAYTTIQTQLNRLVAKRMVARTKHHPAKYRPLLDSQTSGAALLQLLVDTVGGGSIIPLVAQLVSRASLSKEVARELKQVIDDARPQPAKRSTKATTKRTRKKS